MESRVVIVNDVNAEKMVVMHVVLSYFKCDWAKHIFDCLEYFINKVGVKDGDRELEVNVGYGFMLSYLQSLKVIPLGKGSEVQPNANLFKPSEKSKLAATPGETSVSSSTLLQTLMEKKKARERL